MITTHEPLRSELYRRLRGAAYRGQVLLLERLFVEARKLTETLVADPFLAEAQPSSPEMYLAIRLELMHARALISTDAGEEARRLLVSLHDRLANDASQPLLAGTARARVLTDLGGRLSMIGEHERAVSLTQELLAAADPESERAGRLATVLASRRIAAGFEKECASGLVAGAADRTNYLRVALASYLDAIGDAEHGVAVRRALVERRPSAKPALLSSQALRINAAMRGTIVRWWLGEADADDLRQAEEDAWKLAQESRTVPGVMHTERIWRLGSVGIIRAARAEATEREDAATAQLLADRAQDLLAVSYRTRKGSGTQHGVQTTNAYGRVLFFLGSVDAGIRLFREAAEHAEKRYGAASPVARLFRSNAAAGRAPEMRLT